MELCVRRWVVEVRWMFMMKGFSVEGFRYLEKRAWQLLRYEMFHRGLQTCQVSKRSETSQLKRNDPLWTLLWKSFIIRVRAPSDISFKLRKLMLKNLNILYPCDISSIQETEFPAIRTNDLRTQKFLPLGFSNSKIRETRVTLKRSLTPK